MNIREFLEKDCGLKKKNLEESYAVLDEQGMDIEDLKECSQDSLIKYGIKAFAADKIMKALLGSMSQSVGGENLA